MGYAIISVGGKQYRVREGERLLVDRVALDDGATFTPQVLLAGGDGDVAIAPFRFAWPCSNSSAADNVAASHPAAAAFTCATVSSP